jgi:cysteinyl-tRNA synthetase
MDLIATHHTNEIAQSYACCGVQPANYWMHTNMLTLNGARMSKSTGNTLDPRELFTGLKADGEKHPALSKGYSPMTARFFMLQTHYRSTLDFSDPALQAAEKGFNRLMAAYRLLPALKSQKEPGVDIKSWEEQCYNAMNDDFNSPMLVAKLFDAVSMIHDINEGRQKISTEDHSLFSSRMKEFIEDVLGLLPEEDDRNIEIVDDLVQLILDLRKSARDNKDWKTSDEIRDRLIEAGIIVKDTKDGATWNRG